MKDKIINLKNGVSLYALEELNYKNKKYILGIECDKKEENLKDNYQIVEVKYENDSLILENIEDIEILSTLTNLFLAKIGE